MRYRPSVTEGGEVSLPITRDTIWCEIKKKKFKEIGCYQPEDDGFEVVSISLGILWSCWYILIIMFMHVTDHVALLSPITNFQQQMRGFVVENSSPECANGKSGYKMT